MSDHFRLTIAQLNPTVGDIAGNAALARDAWEQDESAGADMVALPEMFITGYSTQDLVNKPAFHLAAMAAVEALATECADGPTLAIGGPYAKDGRLYNGYHICRGGKVVSRQFKHFLPNYNVFDHSKRATHRQPDLRRRMVRRRRRGHGGIRRRNPRCAERVTLFSG